MHLDNGTAIVASIAHNGARPWRLPSVPAARIIADTPDRVSETLSRWFGQSAHRAVDGNGWARLMVAAQSGEATSYRRLLESLRPWLEHYYRPRLPTGMVVTAVKEALIAIHEKRDTYDPSQPFALWLSAIARYRWIARLRGMATAEFCNAERNSPEQPPPGVGGAPIFEDLLTVISDCQREVIRLVALEGCSIADAALRSGQSMPSARMNIGRGMKRMAAAAGRMPPAAA